MCPHQGRDHAHGRRGRGLLGTPGLRRQSAPAALQAVRPHHLLDHAHGQALLEPAELAPVPSPLVHRAVLVGQANVLGVLLDRPLEEALAALTGPDPVVLTRRVVSADRTQ